MKARSNQSLLLITTDKARITSTESFIKMITEDDKTFLQLIIKDLKSFHPESINNIRLVELSLHVSKLSEIILKLLEDKSNGQS